MKTSTKKNAKKVKRGRAKKKKTTLRSPMAVQSKLASGTRRTLEEAMLSPDARRQIRDGREVARSAARALAETKGDSFEEKVVRGTGMTMLAQIDREEGKVQKRKKRKGPTRTQKLKAEIRELKAELKAAKKKAA